MTENQKTKAVFAAVPLVFLQEAGYARWIIAVYGALASFQGQAQDCFPSLAQIALRAGVDQSNVSKAVSILKKAGWIQCQRRRRASSLYRVIPQEGLWARLPLAVLQAHLSKRDILVYACLAVYQGSNSNSYPSRQEIAHRMKIKNLNSISKSISKLKQAGWLGVSQRGPKSNLYSLFPQSEQQGGSVNISDSRPVLSTSDQDKNGLQFRSDQDKKGLQFQSDQDKKGLQFRSDQDKKGLQFQFDQDKKGLQFQFDQDKKGLQFQSDQKYSSSLTNSCLNKTSYKTSSSTESGKTNSTLELKPNSSSLTMIKANNSHPAKSRPPNPSNLTKPKPQASLSYKPMETEKQSMERTIYYALKRSSTREVLFAKVLPHFYEQMKNKVEAAILKEEPGCLYLRGKVLGESLEKKLRHCMGSALVFEGSQYSPESGQSILEYIEITLFRQCPPYTKTSILKAAIREERGFLYVDKSRIMGHHARLLEDTLGNRVVFCESQDVAIA